eukprot:ANDGO_01316.mRNA.1 protein kinase
MSAGGASSCVQCSAGTYAAANGSVCSVCAAGTYSGAGASACTPCAAGTTSPPGSSSCQTGSACVAGQYLGPVSGDAEKNKNGTEVVYGLGNRRLISSSDVSTVTSLSQLNAWCAGDLNSTDWHVADFAVFQQLNQSQLASLEAQLRLNVSTTDMESRLWSLWLSYHSQIKASTSRWYLMTVVHGSVPAGYAEYGSAANHWWSLGSFYDLTLPILCTRNVTGRGNSTCLPCARGSFSQWNASVCTPCAAGTAANMTGSTSCTPCERGTYSSSTSASVCTPCAAGTASNTSGSTSCTPCAAGRYSQSGASSCSVCAAGTFANASGMNACLPCASGWMSAGGASSCVQCSAGTYAAANGSVCSVCAAGTYSGAGASACTPCSEGQVFKAASASCEIVGTSSTVSATTVRHGILLLFLVVFMMI